MYFLSPGPALFLMLSLLSCGKLTYLEATKVVCITNAFFSWGSKEVRKYGRFFLKVTIQRGKYILTYILHSVHARTYCTNKCIEYHNMCNTATLRTVGLHIVLTCLSGSGAFPLLRAVGTMGVGRSPPPPPHNGRLVKPILISRWRTDYAPPDFQTFLWPCS